MKTNNAFLVARWALFFSFALMLAMTIHNPQAARERFLASKAGARRAGQTLTATSDHGNSQLVQSGGNSSHRKKLARRRVKSASPVLAIRTAPMRIPKQRDAKPPRYKRIVTAKSNKAPRPGFENKQTAVASGKPQPATKPQRQIDRGPKLFFETTPGNRGQSPPQVRLGPIEQIGEDSVKTGSAPAESEPVTKAPVESPRKTEPAARTKTEPVVKMETAPPAQPRRQTRVEITRLTVPERQPVSSRFETYLASLQRKIDRLEEAQQNQQDQQDQQNLQFEQTARRLQQMQQASQLQLLERQVAQLQSQALAPSNNKSDDQPAGKSNTATGGKPPVMKAEPATDGSERFTLQIQQAEIAEVLSMLGQLAGLNILVGTGVTGPVSANLQDVTVEEALTVILRSLGYVFQREDKFIFVMTEADAKTRKSLTRKTTTKIYRPNYISAKELLSLITPLITPTIGKIAVTNPSEVGIGSSAGEAGGDSLSQRDALLVHDYPEIIREIDAVFLEMDTPPRQVVIEVMILSVTLNDSLEFGVNFALLNGNGNKLAVFGNGSTLDNSSGFPGGNNQSIFTVQKNEDLSTDDAIATALKPAAEFLANTAGLKYGFIRGDISGFIKALEDIADTNLIASPQLRVLNKQKATLHIGNRLSYKTLAFNDNQVVEDVKFLDVGTKLNIRPFIAPDGLIRMEVHPERSSGSINSVTGLPDTSTTEVTTNVMVRDGTTIVIGGLIEEQTEESYSRIPFLGSIPWVGKMFRSKSERIFRRELIVLITPRIVRDQDSADEGETARYEFEERADYFRNHLSRVNRRNLSRMHYERALDYFDDGELDRALRHVKLALKQSKNDREALRLKNSIEQAIHDWHSGWLTPSE